MLAAVLGDAFAKDIQRMFISGLLAGTGGSGCPLVCPPVPLPVPAAVPTDAFTTDLLYDVDRQTITGHGRRHVPTVVPAVVLTVPADAFVNDLRQNVCP